MASMIFKSINTWHEFKKKTMSFEFYIVYILENICGIINLHDDCLTLEFLQIQIDLLLN